MDATPRLGLGYLSAGQAAKEILVNESLQALDAVVSCAVEEGPRLSPPANPLIGQCFLVDVAPSGDWSGKENCIAVATAGGWRFVTAFPGLTAYVKSLASWATFHDGMWEIGQVRGSAVLVDGLQVVGSRAPAIASAAGGSTVDMEARQILDRILDALRQHGLIET